MVPGTLFWLVKETIVGELPVPLVPVYAMPFPLQEIATKLTPTCAKVSGEPVGVHRLLIALELQPMICSVSGSHYRAGDRVALASSVR
jgi:hypothetical protein